MNDVYVDFERGLFSRFCVPRSLFGVSQGTLTVCRWILLRTRGFSGRRQYAPSMNPCKRDVRSCIRASSRRARFDRMLGWLCLKGGYSVEFDRLVACLKPDLLAIGVPEMTLEVSSETNHCSRFQHMTFPLRQSMKCRTINLHPSVLNASTLNVFLLLSHTLVSLPPNHFMAMSAKSEQPESGDKEVLDVADEPSQGPEDFHGIQDTDTSPKNKLDEVAGGDAKKKAQLALSPNGPYGDEVGKEGNKLREGT